MKIQNLDRKQVVRDNGKKPRPCKSVSGIHIYINDVLKYIKGVNIIMLVSKCMYIMGSCK